MMLKFYVSSIFAVLVQCYCKSAYKTDSTVVCVPCMLEHVFYEPFFFCKKLQIWKICYVNWLNFVYRVKF